MYLTKEVGVRYSGEREMMGERVEKNQLQKAIRKKIKEQKRESRKKEKETKGWKKRENEKKLQRNKKNSSTDLA